MAGAPPHTNNSYGARRRNISAGIFIFLLLAGLTALIVWLIYRPNKPQFTIVSAAIYKLNTTGPPLQTSSMQFTIITPPLYLPPLHQGDEDYDGDVSGVGWDRGAGFAGGGKWSDDGFVFYSKRQQFRTAVEDDRCGVVDQVNDGIVVKSPVNKQGERDPLRLLMTMMLMIMMMSRVFLLTMELDPDLLSLPIRVWRLHGGAAGVRQLSRAVVDLINLWQNPPNFYQWVKELRNRSSILLSYTPDLGIALLSFDDFDYGCDSPLPEEEEEEIDESEVDLMDIGPPASCLREVFRRLSSTELLSAASVSKGWRDMTRKLWRAAEELRLRVSKKTQIGFVDSVLKKCPGAC
ncbi:hypothetical protein ACFE04_018376 [Oxalis oulophora]